MVWRTLARSNYNRIIVSSHLFAHHARLVPKRDVPKYVFVHSPARYIWEPSLDQRASHPLFRLPVAFARKLDKSAAQLGYKLCANSNFVRSRINRCWDRDARVIYPPVDTERISARDWRGDLQGEDERRFASYQASSSWGLQGRFTIRAWTRYSKLRELPVSPRLSPVTGPIFREYEVWQRTALYP